MYVPEDRDIVRVFLTRSARPCFYYVEEERPLDNVCIGEFTPKVYMEKSGLLPVVIVLVIPQIKIVRRVASKKKERRQARMDLRHLRTPAPPRRQREKNTALKTRLKFHYRYGIYPPITSPLPANATKHHLDGQQQRIRGTANK